jgi:CheY-like chemotaxis protein
MINRRYPLSRLLETNPDKIWIQSLSKQIYKGGTKLLKNKETTMILIAEDDPDDRLIIQEAFTEVQVKNPLFFVENGEELLDYLKRRNQFANISEKSLPGLILTDLNMPRKDGREALIEIKSDEELRSIPIVVFTTSKMEEDISLSYQSGVNSFITKPQTFKSFVEIMHSLTKYWLETVELPVY